MGPAHFFPYFLMNDFFILNSWLLFISINIFFRYLRFWF